jgi:hypothetical protein
MEVEQAVWSSYLNGIPAGHQIQGAFSQEEILALRSENLRFQTAIQELLQNKINIETIESEFPLWRDSLIRYKRDPKAIEEVQELSRIRGEILNRLACQKEVSHVRNTEQFAQEYHVEA